MLNLASLNQRVNYLTGKINSIPNPPVADTLSAVLVAGNSAGAKDINMNNNDILAVDNINLTTINGSAYPPTVTTPTLQQVVNAGNGISNFAVGSTASITSTNFTNNRQLLLNADADPTIKMIDNLNSAHFTTLDIDTISLNGTGFAWSDVVAPTLEDVLLNGNISTQTFQLDAGAGANTQSATQIVLDGAGSGGANFIQSNTNTKDSITIKNQDITTSPNPDTTQSSLDKETLSLFNQVPFGYTKNINLSLNPANTGIFHTDTQPFPSAFNIDTTQSLKIKATDSAGAFSKGIEIDKTTPNIYYNLDTGNINDRLVISNNGTIETISVTNSFITSVSPNNIILQHPSAIKALNIDCDTGLSFTTSSVNTNSQYGTNGLFFQSGATSSNLQPSQLALTSTTGSGNSAVITAGSAIITSSVSTGSAIPILTLNNSTAGASAGVAIETYKNGGAGANGDEVYRLSMFGKNATNTKAEYGRITTFIRDSTTPTNGVDGAILISVPVNNTMTTFLDLNGNSNRVNCLRQLNIQNNDIISSGGDIHLNATASTGTGKVILQPKVGSYIIMNNLPTSVVGLPSGAVWNNLGVLNIAP